MAKTTSKTKAKTKTTKRSVSTRTKSATSVKSTASDKTFGLSARSMHYLNVVSGLVLSLVAVLMMAPAKFPLSLSYLTKDSLLSDQTTVFVAADRVQYDLELRWLLVGLLLFSAIYSILLLTRWKDSYAKALNGRVWFWRWAYLAVSTAVLVKISAITTGVYDIMTLKLLFGLTAGSFALAWLSERQNEKGGKHAASAYLLGLGAMLLPWVAIAASGIATYAYGLVRLPWYAYALKTAVMLGSLLIFLTLWKSNKRSGRFSDYRVSERTYVGLAWLTQAAAAVILITGLSN